MGRNNAEDDNESSLSDNGEEEKNMEVKEKPPSPPAISNLVLEEKSLLDCDDVLPHTGESEVYQKIPFTLLAPSAATTEGYC